ncbi:MAG: class I SAM-dependent methyltransferase [Candidatus Dormiibacterota bacterium]
MEHRRRLRETFETVADRYAAARPAYPEALFDDLVDLAQLRPGAKLLEIGCGPGIATRPLAERGYEIHAIELGAGMTAAARRALAAYPNVTVEQGAFEDWTPPPGMAFDLVYAATAWHWIDPEIAYERAAARLRGGAALAFWSADHALPADADPFFEEIQHVYDELGEHHPGPLPPPPPEAAPTQEDAIERSGWFNLVGVRRYVWERRYTADEYVALLDTFSGHRSMPEASRAHLYREIRRRLATRPDRSVRRHWLAILHVARAV